MNNLKPNEIRLTGEWKKDATGKIVGDDITSRIQWLARNALVRIATASGGWDVLYRDPQDGRLWELTYPYSDWHGSGPPDLRHISSSEAVSKYGDRFSRDLR